MFTEAQEAMGKDEQLGSQAAPRNIVQLDYADHGGIVTVTPKDKDRFNLSVIRAVEACTMAIAEDKFRAQLNILSQRLATWLNAHEDHGIRAAYITLRDSEFLFLVVRDTVSYDREFSDALSSLDLEIAGDADLASLRLDTMAIPDVSKASLGTFLDPRFSAEFVHGERK